MFVIGLSGLGIYKLWGIKTNANIVANNSTSNNNNSNDKTEQIVETNSKVEIYEENNVQVDKKEFNLAFLGEIMMGGTIGDSLGYNYMNAFKSITEYTKNADYTAVNLPTNIIDLEKITDPKTKYIVTTKILNAFNALDVDGVNIANDRIMDFGKDVFNDTKEYIEKEYDLIGLQNTITFAEHDGIKVAIIGICNEVIGNQNTYENAGIMMYNMKNIKEMIKEAKEKANTVILLTHLGLENTHTVTSIMSWFYRELIKAGADIVLGSHALGMYPVEIYNGKPIVYSMGYLMSDTTYLKGKETGIFNVIINEQGYLDRLEITPLYINAAKQTILYSEYSKSGNEKLLNYLVSDLTEEDYDKSNDKITINFAKD